MPKTISMYQTEDGKIFQNKEEAEKHEQSSETYNKVRSVLRTFSVMPLVYQNTVVDLIVKKYPKLVDSLLLKEGEEKKNHRNGYNDVKLLLSKDPNKYWPVSEIQERLNISYSTVNNHVNKLLKEGLISRAQKGVYRINTLTKNV